MRRGFHAPGRFFQKFCGQRGEKCPFTGAREAGWREAQQGQSPKKGTERVSLRGRDRGAVASGGLRLSENPAAKGFCQKHGASPQGRAACGANATEGSTKTRHRATVSAIPPANRRGHGTQELPRQQKSGERKPPPFVRPGVRAAEAAPLRNGLRRQERHLVFERNSRENR